MSGYRFMEGWYFEPGMISYEDFFDERQPSRGKGQDHLAHLLGWWNQRDNPAVLLLSYEHMVADPKLAVTRVARFCDIPLDGELLALTLEHTSRAVLLRHKDRFDDAMMRELSERKGDLPKGSESSKVRDAGTGQRQQELPESIRRAPDDMWRSDVRSQIGFAEYAALNQELRNLGFNGST